MAVLELAPLHLLQDPTAVFDGALLCTDGRDHGTIVGEFKNLNFFQLAIGVHRAYVDGKVSITLTFFEPDPCGALADAAFETGLEQLGLLPSPRCQVVTHCERYRNEHRAQSQQHAQGPPRAQATGAQNGELRRVGHASQHPHRANQHRHGQQFIDPVGGLQTNVNQHVVKAVTQIGIVKGLTPNVVEIVDQVKEQKQGQERQQDKAHRTKNFAVEVSTPSGHALAPKPEARDGLNRSRQLTLFCLTHNKLSARNPTGT